VLNGYLARRHPAAVARPTCDDGREVTSMRRPYREFQAIKAVARVLAEERAEEWTMASVEENRKKAVSAGYAELWAGAGLRGRTPRRAVVCPAKIVAHSPDPELRRLGQEQAQEAHATWGPCCPCRRGFVPAWTITPKNSR
jgi:hypothetical protein